MAQLTGDTLFTQGLLPTATGSHGAPITLINFLDTTPRTQAITTGDNVITGLSVSVPIIRRLNFRFISVRWCGEVDQLWNKTWWLRRNGVDIGRPPVAGSRLRGTTCAMDTHSANSQNNDSTPAQLNFWFWDNQTLPDTSTITYQLCIQSNQNTTLYTNRTVSDTDAANRERMTSSILVMEVSS